MDWNLVAVAVSIVAVIVAGLAWYESKRSADASEKSASAARDSVDIAKLALETGQRPWVCITKLTPTTPQLAPRFKAEIQFGNLGSTPALDLTVISYLKIFRPSIPDQLDFAPYDGGSNYVMGPGSDVTTSNNIELTAQDIEDIPNLKAQLVSYGKITYRDAFQHEHETKWCTFYNRNSFCAASKHNSIT